MFNKIRNYVIRLAIAYSFTCIMFSMFIDVFDISFHIGMVLGIVLCELFLAYERKREKAKYNIED